jgi:hypothetical protein
MIAAGAIKLDPLSPLAPRIVRQALPPQMTSKKLYPAFDNLATRNLEWR